MKHDLGAQYVSTYSVLDPYMHDAWGGKSPVELEYLTVYQGLLG